MQTNDEVFNFKLPKCAQCGKGAFLSIDALCSAECRSKYHKIHGHFVCAFCGRAYDGKKGWDKPSFSWYLDTSFVCPECIKTHNQKVENAKVNIKKLEKELAQIEKNIQKLENTMIQSNIQEDEEGKYFVYADDEQVYFNEFVEAVEHYKKHKDKILADREELYRLEVNENNIANRLDDAYSYSKKEKIKANT